MKVLTEEFGDINSLLRVINSRKNNQVMSDTHSSKTGSEDFTGSSSYDEAVRLIRTGYVDILKDVKDKLSEITRQNKQFDSGFRPMPRNSIVGYVPNVPNAIRNIPESMINTNIVPQKRKTLSVVYSIEGNCNETVEFFIKTGTILLAAINIIERSGIQVKLSVAFMTSQQGSETTCPTVVIKNYGQRFDLQKVCFPLAHPSMLRRIGFKWLETTPQITESEFSFGYGRDPNDLKLLDKTFKDKFGKNTYVLNTHWIRSNNYSVEKLLNFLDFNKKDV